MKTFLSGMAGALIVALAFVGGAMWKVNQPFARYEMHVVGDGVYRLDRTTGKIHVNGASGGTAIAGELPETVVKR